MGGTLFYCILYMTMKKRPYLNKQKNQKQNRIERLVNYYFKQVEDEGIEPSDGHFREEEILNKLKERIANEPIKKPYRFKVAASIVGLIMLSSLAAWFYFSSDTRTDYLVLTAENTHIEPGGNRATLTLADGTVVDLREHENGQIAHQDGSVISKPSDGMLIYDTDGVQTSQMTFNTISTPSGGQFAVVLPDGSKVWLNAESTLTYPTSFDADVRTVELTGEAYFEIEHNEQKPFQIKNGDQLVTVLGTKFNINSYADEPYIHTTLVEGSVQIDHGEETVILKPGEQANIQDGISVNKVDPLAATAWKNGDFIFKNDGLRHIMRQIERWYDVEIEYEGNVDDLRFGGIVSRSQNLSTVLTMLEKTGRVRFEMKVAARKSGDKKPHIKVIKIENTP